MPKLTENIRNNIITLYQNNKSQRNIAVQLGISKTGVQHTIKRYQLHKSIEDLPRSGRPTIINEREARCLTRISKLHPKFTSRQLRSEIPSFHNTSLTTVKLILRKYGLFGRIAARKPKLNKKQIKNRLVWCRSYIKCDSEFWNNVIFTDESKIEMFPTRREYVRRPQNTRNHSKYVTQTVKFGAKSIMLWGMIKGNGERYLLKSSGTIDSVEYQKILRQGLLPNIRETEILQQDNAPCHTSKSTRNFLDLHDVCCISDWPSQSPDLNIIEPLWKILKDRVSKHSPRSIQDLWNICEREWMEIPDYVIMNLYKSIPRRISSIIKSRGQNSKY